MRILIISTFFPPMNSIASHRPYSWAKYWTLAGHDVVVVTTQKHEAAEKLKFENPGYQLIELPIPFFHGLKPGYRQGKESRFKSFLKGKLEKLRNSRGVLYACRMPDVTDLWIHPAFKAIKKLQPFDLVVSTSGPYCVHLLANKVKKNKMANKWIADFRDRWSDSLQFPGLFPFSLIEKYLEKKVIKNCDAITTVSEPFAQHYRNKTVKKVYTITNGFDSSEYSRSTQSNFTNDKFRIVYTGSYWDKFQDISPLLEAIYQISQDPKHAALLGRLEVLFFGGQMSNLNHSISNYKVEKWVKIAGMVDRDEILSIQNEAHFLLFLPWNDNRIDGVLSGKIFEYLYSESPIISVGAKHLEGSQKLLLESGKGTLLSNVEEIQGFLINQLSSPKKQKQKISNELAKKYNRKDLAGQMLKIL